MSPPTDQTDLSRPAHAPSLHARLKAETTAEHRAVEAALGLDAAHLTADHYARVLRAFLGFYRPLEQRLPSALQLAPPLRFSPPARTALLVRDLRAVGVPAAELGALPSCPALPELTSAARLAGCLYVIEGAALGGRFISRAVQDRLGFTPEHGCAFFFGEGPETGARWKQVLEWLEEVAQMGAPPETVVSAAREHFTALHHWCEAQGATR